MYYVTDPDRIVSNIETLLSIPESERRLQKQKIVELTPEKTTQKYTELIGHTLDTKEHIRDILR